MAVYGLTRVSTDGQEDNSSLEEQGRKITGLCMAAGLPDPTIIQDVVSGSVPLELRANAGPIVRELKTGDVVVASKLDRIFRNATDALSRADAFKKMGVALYLIDMGTEPVTNNGTSRMFFGMLALMAEFERERISERTNEGRKAKAAKQGYVGGKVPFGFRVQGGGKNAMLIEDEGQQSVIAAIKTLHAEGKSLRDIASALQTQNSETVSLATISKIVKS